MNESIDDDKRKKREEYFQCINNQLRLRVEILQLHNELKANNERMETLYKELHDGKKMWKEPHKIKIQL